MQLGVVVGEVVSTCKDLGLTGSTLLMVQPLSPAGEPIGRVAVAVDSVGAGVGERVFVVRGREASLPFSPAMVPTDLSIVGIVDHWDVALPV